MKENKEEKEWSAIVVLIGDRMPILIDQPERSAHRGDLRTVLGRERTCQEKDDPAAKDKPGQESAENEHEANVARGHGVFRWARWRQLKAQRDPSQDHLVEHR